MANAPRIGDFDPAAHAATHQDGGGDELATSTPSANAIPKADAGGELDPGWVPDGADGTAIHSDDVGAVAALTDNASPASTDLLVTERGDGTLGKTPWSALPSGGGGAPSAHASTHENGGSDEINVAGLSGELADPQPPKTHAASHASGAADEIAHGDLADVGANTHAQIDAALAASSVHESSTANPHGTSLANLAAGNLSDLNALVADATLDDSSATRTPTSHAASHQHGGSDEIATATPTANAIPKAGASGKVAAGWIPDGADATAIHTNDTGVVAGFTTEASPAAGDFLLLERASDGAFRKTPWSSLPSGGGGGAPAAHASTHQHGGSDEVATATPGANAIPKAGAGGTLASGWIDETAIDHANLANTGATSHADIDTALAAAAAHEASTANPHATSIANIGSGTLAQLNAAVVDATLDDAADPRTPTTHAASHASGGSDALSHTSLDDIGTLTHAQIDSAIGGLPQDNFSATAAPTVNDDDTAGYEVGSRWVDVNERSAYVCLSATTGAAKWQKTSSVGVATGLLEGGLLSINGTNNNRFDVAAGKGYVVDAVTDVDNPQVTRVSWSAFTNQALTNIATDRFTFIMIDSSGSIVQVAREPTAAERRTNIVLGRIAHIDNATITAVVDIPHVAIQPEQAGSDVAIALKSFNLTGNVFSAGTLLQLQKSEGVVFRFGAGFRVNPNSPHTITVPAANPIARIIRRWRNGSGGWNTSLVTSGNIDPFQYDDGSGTLATVPANRWTSQTIVLSTTGIVIVYYGQELFNSQSLAVAAAGEPIEQDPDISDLPIRGWLATSGATASLAVSGVFTAAANGIAGASGAVGGSGITDHGNLNGLSDDDHPQYLLEDGTRAMSGNLDLDNNNIANVGTLNAKNASSLLALTGATNQVSALTSDAAPSWVLTESSAGVIRKTAPADIGGGGGGGGDPDITSQWFQTWSADFSQYYDTFTSRFVVNNSGGSIVRPSLEGGVIHPLTLRTGSAASSYIAFSSQGQAVFGSKFSVSLQWVFKTGVLPTASVDYRYRIGWLDDFRHGGSPFNGVYIAMERAESTTNFVGVTLDSAAKTTTSLGVAFAASTWYAAKIEVNGDGTSVDFEVRQLGTAFSSPTTVSTNIPTNTTSGLYRGFEISKVAGSGQRNLTMMSMNEWRKAA